MAGSTRSIAARGADALDRQGAIVERRGLVAGGVLDRQAGDAGCGRAADIRGETVEVGGEPVGEIGVDRHVDGRGDGAEMGQHLIERHGAVGPSRRPGEARAGGGERLEAEALQVARAADIPRIGHDEAAGLMEPAKLRAFFGDWNRHVAPPTTSPRRSCAPRI